MVITLSSCGSNPAVLVAVYLEHHVFSNKITTKQKWEKYRLSIRYLSKCQIGMHCTCSLVWACRRCHWYCVLRLLKLFSTNRNPARLVASHHRDEAQCWLVHDDRQDVRSVKTNKKRNINWPLYEAVNHQGALCPFCIHLFSSVLCMYPSVLQAVSL